MEIEDTAGCGDVLGDGPRPLGVEIGDDDRRTEFGAFLASNGPFPRGAGNDDDLTLARVASLTCSAT